MHHCSYFCHRSNSYLDDIYVSITEYTPAYPEFYEIDSSAPYIKGYYEKQSESKTFHGFPVFKKEEEFLLLYLGLEGTWRISREAYEQGQGFAKSLEKGLPDPALAKGWKIWMSNEWQEDKNFTISRRSSVYPDVYIVEFPESLPEIRRKLQDKGSLQKKNPEIYWSFTNTGGGEYPPTNIFPFFS